MNMEAEKFAPTRRRGDPGANGPGLALAPSSQDDDTDYDYDYDDTPSGNIWRPGAEPGQPPAANPGGRAAGPLPGRETAAGERSAGSRRLSPSLIFRTRHNRPGRGSVRPDKETP
jgi:hypothetical protein